MMGWMERVFGLVFAQRRALDEGVSSPVSLREWLETLHECAPTWPTTWRFCLKMLLASVFFWYMVRVFEKWVNNRWENGMRNEDKMFGIVAVAVLGGLLVMSVLLGFRYVIDGAVERAVMSERSRLGGDVKWQGAPLSYVNNKLNVTTDAQIGFRADGVIVWRAVEAPAPQDIPPPQPPK